MSEARQSEQETICVIDTQDTALTDVLPIWIRLNSEEVHESPIDINISKTTSVECVPIKWMHFEVPPKKMKITNTGHTVILSAKWGQERPYVCQGPLTGKYVFSQIHLHWGKNDMEGSEHTIDGSRLPGEMHVVCFKSCYLTQESALKERDGVIILVYMIKLQETNNQGFQLIIDSLQSIEKAHSSIKLDPTSLNFLFREFTTDYFLYCGSVSTSSCVHHITWFITRVPIGVSNEQTDALRYMYDEEDALVKRNFRSVQPRNGRKVFHVAPSTSKYSTLLPIPKQEYCGERKSISSDPISTL